MKLLIIGATGGTGRELVAQALAAGHEVTALVRNPEKLGTRHERLRLVQGDILDPDSVDVAVVGQDAVLSSLGTKSIFGRVVIFSEGTRNLLNAMTNHGVRRHICITGIGAGDSKGHGGFLYDKVVLPLFLKRIYDDKDRMIRIGHFGILTPDRLESSMELLGKVMEEQGLVASKVAVQKRRSKS